MLSRLPISSAQLKAGNNSEKLKQVLNNNLNNNNYCIPCIDKKN